MSRVLTRDPLEFYRRFLAPSSQMLKHSARQSDDQSPSAAEPSQQLWTSAACPTVDHDARPESEVPSSGRPPLSPSCVGIMAADGGIAVANLYYNQPMLSDIGQSFGVAADVIALLPMLTQIGYALGLFLFVPLGDVVDRRQLVSALLFGTGSSLAVLALGVVLLDVGIQAAMNGNQSTVPSLAPQATSRTNTIYMVIYFIGGALARTRAASPGIISAGRGRRLSGSSIAAPRSSRGFAARMPATAA
jgi:hypothetical protein